MRNLKARLKRKLQIWLDISDMQITLTHIARWTDRNIADIDALEEKMRDDFEKIRQEITTIVS